MKIYYSKSKLVKAFLLALVMTFAALFISAKVFFYLFAENRSVLSSFSANDLVLLVFGIICTIGVLLFGAGGVVFVIRLFHSEPQVIISSEGIEDKRLGVGIIEWSDVAVMFLADNRKAQWIILNLHSTKKYYPRLSKFELFLKWINGQKGSKDLLIRFNTLNVPIDDVWDYIEENIIKPRKEKGIYLVP